MIKRANFLTGEVIDLSDVISLLSPTDTPLTTLLQSKGKVSNASDITVTWREKELNTNRGTLILEGADAGTVINSTRTMKDNVCQILEKVTAVSGTVSALNPKGIEDAFQAEVQDRLTELKRDMEWYFINGTKTLESGSTPRQMNGLINLIASTNKIDLGTKATNKNVLEESDILDGMQKIWDAGAMGEYYLFCNASDKRRINNLLKNATNSRVVLNQGENKLGIIVQEIETDFGIVKVVLNRHVQAGTIFAVDLDLVEIAELRPAFYEELAKTGDYIKGHVIAENTIKLLNSKAGMVITGINA